MAQRGPWLPRFGGSFPARSLLTASESAGNLLLLRSRCCTAVTVTRTVTTRPASDAATHREGQSDYRRESTGSESNWLILTERPCRSSASTVQPEPVPVTECQCHQRQCQSQCHQCQWQSAIVPQCASARAAVPVLVAVTVTVTVTVTSTVTVGYPTNLL